MEYLEIEWKPWYVRKKIYSKLPYKFIGQMVDDTEWSGQSLLEKGFVVCYDDDKGFYSTESVVGGVNEIELPRKECRLPVGGFHTHPGGALDFSVSDIYNAIKNEEWFTCIGVLETQEEKIAVYKVSYPQVRVKCVVINNRNEEIPKYRDLLKKSMNKIDYLREKLEQTTKYEEYIQYYRELNKAYDEGEQIIREMEEKDIISYEDTGIRSEKGKVYFDLIDRGDIR